MDRRNILRACGGGMLLPWCAMGGALAAPLKEVDVPRWAVWMDNLAPLFTSRACALTFDDGPDPVWTPMISRHLRDAGIRSIFFLVGERMKTHPEIVRRLIYDGHEIGLHSYRHDQLNRLSERGLDGDIARTMDMAASAGCPPCVWFRPPYGLFNRGVLDAAARHGLQTILWDVDPRDWATHDSDQIVAAVVTHLRPGAMILFHSTLKQMVNAMERIIAGIKDKGYGLQTVSEWAGA